MPISIYPPTLQSTQPAFLVGEPSYPIYFTLQQITSPQEVEKGHIQIRIVYQTDNKTTVADQSQYPDGTIYKNGTEMIREGYQYYIPILLSDLQDGWLDGMLYKVQIRFGTTPKYESVGDFATWKQKQIDNQTFSEWSTVMIIKAISRPTVQIRNSGDVKADVESTERVEPTITPLFSGSYNIRYSSKEPVDKYKFDLYLGKEANPANLVETSGWLQHNSGDDVQSSKEEIMSIDTHRFKNILTNTATYTVTYSVTTLNGYQITSSPYVFSAVQSYYSELKGAELIVDSLDPYCKENGCLRLYLMAMETLAGTYVITRSSEKTNYSIWEDLQFLTFNNLQFNSPSLIYDDFTVESGIKYRYAIQQENAAGLRTAPVFDNNYHYIDFEYSYLYSNGVQLKLSLNQKINSFKHTVLASKQDTLGDKYPHILKNGYAYYAEFPLNGMISFQMDKDQTFFKLRNEGFYYNDQLVIPIDKFEDFNMVRNPDRQNEGIIIEDEKFIINSNLTDNNIFIERMFREKAEEFLNNYEYKLYKSPTEGNIVIILTNISLTPNTTVGRMVYEFSATAYEVVENTLQNLDEFGIIDIGKFESLVVQDISLSIGQVVGVYTTKTRAPSVNIYDIIKEQEEINYGTGYKMQLERLRSFWIDLYPQKDFSFEINELQAEKAVLIKENKSTYEIDQLIQEYRELQDALNNPNLIFTIQVNDNPIKIFPDRIYSLDTPITSLSLVDCPYPIIVNYIAELTQQQDLTTGTVTAIDASRVWGQVSGLFTGTDKILKTYNYDYGPGKSPLQVFNKRPDKTVIYDQFGNVIVDNTNFNVYKTINLLDIIKEETRKQVELQYKIDGGFYQDEDGRWTNGFIYFEFGDIVIFDIETEPGTVIYIGKQEDGSDKIPIKVGPTGRYTLNPMETLVSYIALADPQFCLINYQCLTNQMTITRE